MPLEVLTVKGFYSASQPFKAKLKFIQINLFNIKWIAPPRSLFQHFSLVTFPQNYNTAGMFVYQCICISDLHACTCRYVYLCFIYKIIPFSSHVPILTPYSTPHLGIHRFFFLRSNILCHSFPKEILSSPFMIILWECPNAFPNRSFDLNKTLVSKVLKWTFSIFSHTTKKTRYPL